MNGDHLRYVEVSLRHIDELLTDALRILGAGATTPFQRYRHDATLVQEKVAADYVARVRDAMLRLLEQYNLEPSPEKVSALHATHTLLCSAEIAVEELAPRYLRGYGDLPEEAARRMNGFVAELLDILTQLDRYLMQRPDRDAIARIAQLEQGEQAQLVTELARMIDAHGLIDLRPALERIVERMESERTEIAIFGRVNSGKSSLLNFLLGTAVLPVGTNPVTAVPVRVVYGRQPWGRAEFTDAIPEKFVLGRLAEFASERMNPSNIRHVTSLEVEIPAPLLKDDVVLVDTPGLGSLAAYGTAEAMAYLPRCDLGLVLIDAASTVLPDDLALIDALRNSGAKVLVLLSKADLLSSQEREQAVAYVEGQIEKHVGASIPVRPISTMPAHVHLSNAWRDRILAAVLRDRAALRRSALDARIAWLQHAVRLLLEKRLDASRPSNPGAKRARADEALAGALGRLDDLLRTASEISIPLAAFTTTIVNEAAHNVAIIWNQNQEVETAASALVAASLKSRMRAAANGVWQTIVKIRATLEAALQHARELLDTDLPDVQPLPEPRSLPSVDAFVAIPDIRIRKPTLAVLGTVVLRLSARRQLSAMGLQTQIGVTLEDYEDRLKRWRRETLLELRKTYVDHCEALRVLHAEPGTSITPETRTSIERDLERLRELGEGDRSATATVALDDHSLHARSPPVTHVTGRTHDARRSAVS